MNYYDYMFSYLSFKIILAFIYYSYYVLYLFMFYDFYTTNR